MAGCKLAVGDPVILKRVGYLGGEYLAIGEHDHGALLRHGPAHELNDHAALTAARRTGNGNGPMANPDGRERPFDAAHLIGPHGPLGERDHLRLGRAVVVEEARPAERLAAVGAAHVAAPAVEAPCGHRSYASVIVASAPCSAH